MSIPLDRGPKMNSKGERLLSISRCPDSRYLLITGTTVRERKYEASIDPTTANALGRYFYVEVEKKF